MEIDDEDIFESEVEFRQLDCESEPTELAELERNSLEQTDCIDEAFEPSDESQCPAEPEAGCCSDERKLPGNDEEIEEKDMAEPLAKPPPPVQLDVSDEYLDLASKEQVAPISRKGGAGGGGKWARRKRRNPFISFFLSMYSRRPRQRAAEVARQAGRQWARMSDSQRKLYTREAQLGPS